MKLSNIIQIIKEPRKSGGSRIIYKLKCSMCPKIIKVRKSDYILSNFTGKCISCSHKKKPFQSIYNSLKNDWRKLNNTLTYKQFLNFTKISNCHYCLSNIKWNPYGIVNGSFVSRSYYLDRKNNKLGYSKQNCVVCCTKCNIAKGNRYTYKEWYGMTAYFRK